MKVRRRCVPWENESTESGRFSGCVSINEPVRPRRAWNRQTRREIGQDITPSGENRSFVSGKAGIINPPMELRVEWAQLCTGKFAENSDLREEQFPD